MNKGLEMNFKELLSFYEHHLFEQVMPFWTRYCVDWENGGINNIVKEDGKVTSTDKIMWSQARALWTFSAIYNYLDADDKWLEIAHNLAAFILKHGRGDNEKEKENGNGNTNDNENSNGKWVFRVQADGTPVDSTYSIYVDAFVAYGFAEYYRATGSQQAVDIMVENFERIVPLLRDHTTIPVFPLPIPEGLQSLAPSMIYSLIFYEAGLLLGRNDMLDKSLELSELIMNEHVKEDIEILLEYVQPGGEPSFTDAGRTFLPGHSIECMWFLEKIFHHFGRKDQVDMTLKVIRWNLEQGWDEEYGGIFLARHLGGGEPVRPKGDSKVWWPATESLYALLRAYEISREDWCMEWYWRVHEYAFSHYPNREYGEWNQNLDRFGNVMGPAVESLPVKDPFHLPRALIYAILTLRRLAA